MRLWRVEERPPFARRAQTRLVNVYYVVAETAERALRRLNVVYVVNPNAAVTVVEEEDGVGSGRYRVERRSQVKEEA